MDGGGEGERGWSAPVRSEPASEDERAAAADRRDAARRGYNLVLPGEIRLSSAGLPSVGVGRGEWGGGVGGPSVVSFMFLRSGGRGTTRAAFP